MLKNRLTSKKYWESYYKSGYSNRSHIISVCSYYDKFWDILISKDKKHESIIELGGYPGRYLAYLAERHKLIPTCLDYNSDSSQVESAFAVMGIKEYRIIQEDALTFEPKEQYDYVISNGFIEHFENFDAVLDMHLKYLKNTGKLFVMIPNMKGYNKLYKYFMDYNNLKIHNLNCMSLKVFKNFSKRNNLKIKHLSYFGGFSYNVHQSLNYIQRFIYKAHYYIFNKIFNKVLKKYPNQYFSSSIIAIFERN